MDPELKQYLDGKFAELDGKVAEVDVKLASLDTRFATKDDLARLEGWLKTEFQNCATKQDLEKFATKEGLERLETKLLTEFHKWASPAESRIRSFGNLLHAFDADLDWLKERVKKLENRPS
jgi:hypothetical protein